MSDPGDPRPLAGLKVLDLSRLLPGPFATMVLSDLGAEVDKVEDPRGGDYMRAFPPHVGGMNASFVALNRGKRSVSLDLKTEAGRDAFLRLLPRYDVLIETFRPGVLAKLGLGYEQLSERHPGLVYCAISGYGQDGPMSQRAGHDLNYLARAGVLGLTGPEQGPPQVPGVQVADIGGGALYAVIGVLAALQAREKTGRGRLVDVSMCEGSLSFAIFGIMNHLTGLPLPYGTDMLMGGLATYQTYRTKDGRYMALGALEPKFWTGFCNAVGIKPSMEAVGPGPHQVDWKKKVAAIFAERTFEEWVKFAEEHDVCIEPVLTPQELVTDPQHVHRRMFVGEPPMPRTPVAPPPDPAPAPQHGEHTAEVLREAGLSADEIAALG